MFLLEIDRHLIKDAQLFHEKKTVQWLKINLTMCPPTFPTHSEHNMMWCYLVLTRCSLGILLEKNKNTSK